MPASRESLEYSSNTSKEKARSILVNACAVKQATRIDTENASTEWFICLVMIMIVAYHCGDDDDIFMMVADHDDPHFQHAANKPVDGKCYLFYLSWIFYEDFVLTSTFAPSKTSQRIFHQLPPVRVAFHVDISCPAATETR